MVQHTIYRSLVEKPMTLPSPLSRIATALVLGASMTSYEAARADDNTLSLTEHLGIQKGICLMWGVTDATFPIQLAEASELIIYVQSPNAEHVAAARALAEQKGLLGTRIYVEQGDLRRIHLADNLVDGAIVAGNPGQLPPAERDELLRVMHPGARAVMASQLLTKPWPEGFDSWSHPYHGPDNNPQSRDQYARGPLLTQFMCEPWYVPMPQVTVAAGGRVFKAFGHIAMKRREWPWVNTLVAINGFNGTQLWQKPLAAGFMIHRNTLVATDDVLLVAEGNSCQRLDVATGQLIDEIVIPSSMDPDGVWKWMALEQGTLYALVGEREPPVAVMRGTRPQPGWPWTTVRQVYGGKDAWGYGRTLLAIDPDTKQIVWSHKSDTAIDGRSVCLANQRIFLYSPQQYLACVDTKTGKPLWKRSDAALLEAIGEHGSAQSPGVGFASSSYAKANDVGVYFAGPQRKRLVAVSAEDGSVMWDYPSGNFQLILRDDALYGMGRAETSKKFDYATGRVLADLDCYRGNCTRATASVDSIFTRGYRHTGTMRLDLSNNQAKRMALMRPACQDGVITAQGHMYWGPWMCDCNHSLVGMVCMSPAGDFDFSLQATEEERLDADTRVESEGVVVAVDERDWPGYRGGPARQSRSTVTIPPEVRRKWHVRPPGKAEPTAPVAAGGLVFWSGRDGVVRACDAESGEAKWTAFTGGSVRFSPALWEGRVYVGSGDGWIYCLDAASGRRFWRFRAAPVERKILVHGRLLSTWPVGSGVLVQDGVVYAAAGIASYDGTHVYALDAASGAIRWQNNTSGRLVDDQHVTGVSVQGHLLLHDNRLYLAGGNVVSPAIYDMASGKCLNKLDHEWLKAPPAPGQEAFPKSGRDELFRFAPRGRELFLVGGEVRVFDQLLYSPPVYQRSGMFGGFFLQAASNDRVIRATADRIVRLDPGSAGDKKPGSLWESKDFADPRSLAVCANAVVVAGRLAGAEGDASGGYAVSALGMKSGQPLWTRPLPAAPVSWGVAVDRKGRVIVALADGRLVGFGG